MLDTQTAGAVLIFIIGVINVLPVGVFFDHAQTEKLYGVKISGESLEILMRHRAILFALLG